MSRCVSLDLSHGEQLKPFDFERKSNVGEAFVVRDNRDIPNATF